MNTNVNTNNLILGYSIRFCVHALHFHQCTPLFDPPILFLFTQGFLEMQSIPCVT